MPEPIRPLPHVTPCPDLRRLERRVEDMPKPEAILRDWARVQRASTSAAESAERSADIVQGVELRLKKLEKRQDAVEGRLDDGNGAGHSEPPPSWDDDVTESIPVERIMRHPAARQLVQRELEAQEKLRAKEEQDEIEASEKRSALRISRIYQVAMIVFAAATLALSLTLAIAKLHGH